MALHLALKVSSYCLLFMQIYEYAHNSNLSSFYLLNTVNNGISIFSDDNTIINNFIPESRFDGVFIGGKDRNIIKGNTVVNVGQFGIRLNTVSDDNQVLDNTIISSVRDGIVVVGERNVIEGNTINQSGQNGIEVGTCEDIIIEDNSITNSGEFGIEIGSGSLNTVVIGNTLAGNTNGNLSVQGEDPITAGNIPNLPPP